MKVSQGMLAYGGGLSLHRPAEEPMPNATKGSRSLARRHMGIGVDCWLAKGLWQSTEVFQYFKGNVYLLMSAGYTAGRREHQALKEFACQLQESLSSLDDDEEPTEGGKDTDVTIDLEHVSSGSMENPEGSLATVV